MFAAENADTKKCNEKLQANKARKQEQRALEVARSASGEDQVQSKELSSDTYVHYHIVHIYAC